MNALSTVAPRAHNLDPKIFLDYFTACGGGYCVTPDRQLWLGVLQGCKNPDRDIAAQILREVKPSDAERIKAYLIARREGESEAADKWSNTLVRFRIAERALDACLAGEIVDDTEADELCNIMSDARWELISMPAPDRPALLWKLEYLFEGSNGCLDPYSTDLLQQTVADCRRLLVEG